MISGTTFHKGKDGQIRNNQGQVIDLGDSRDFDKAIRNKGKKMHISNQQMFDDMKETLNKRKSNKNNRKNK